MNKYTVIDAHCDTASEIFDKKQSLFSNQGHISIDRTFAYHSHIQFFAAWISKSVKNPMLRGVEILCNLKDEIKKNQQYIEEITTTRQLHSVMERGKRGAILAIEDARALCGSIYALHMFYALGVRAITLAWNDDNEVTDGSNSLRGAGLTPFGKQVVRKMNALSMIIDVSHITKKGFWDVLETSSSPVMASHSNCAAVCNHRRNLDDAQIKALIENKGILCINLYPPFLTRDQSATVDNVFRHIDHILSLGGENHLGIGADFDGVDSLPIGFSGVESYPRLFDKMAQHGYSEAFIHKITHQNMIKFMERIEK